jgi:pSer/pThr/pTyr-binding forkhead associated (FHA) protein
MVEFIRASGGNRNLALKGSSWQIGTEAECEIRFDPIGDEGIAAHHAQIYREGGRYAVSPVGESLSWLNAKRLRKTQYLRSGDELAFGQLDGPGLRFRIHEAGKGGQSGRPALILKVSRGPVNKSIPRIDRDVTIGRGEHCDIQVDDPQVSSTHAEIVWEQDSWRVRDLQSTNGTFVDGVRIESVPIDDHIKLELTSGGPALHLEVEKALRTKEFEEAPLSFTRVVQRYFGEGADGPAGRQTMMIRQAFHKIQTKQKKRYGLIIGIIGTLLVVAAIALYVQHLRVKKLEEMHSLAENMFYTMKSLELQIASLQALVEKRGDHALKAEVAQKLRRQQELQEGYSAFAREVGISQQDLPEDEWLIYRIARLFGECDASMPQGFVQSVKEYIRKWQSTPRLREAIERAVSLGYTKRVSETMLLQNLPPQFFYLALQESDFDVNRCGPPTRHGIAKGMWMFIPQTAIAYGLRTGPLVELRRPDPRDERHDFEKSTRAAAQYLRFLYETEAQASGLLVMACYNWGEDKVEPLVRRMPENPQERNFWKLIAKHNIPEETYDYVFYIFSAAVIGENPKLFGFSFENPLKTP